MKSASYIAYCWIRERYRWTNRGQKSTLAKLIVVMCDKMIFTFKFYHEYSLSQRFPIALQVISRNMFQKGLFLKENDVSCWLPACVSFTWQCIDIWTKSYQCSLIFVDYGCLKYAKFWSRENPRCLENANICDHEVILGYSILQYWKHKCKYFAAVKAKLEVLWRINKASLPHR